MYLILNVSKFAVNLNQPDNAALQRTKTVPIARLRPEVKRVFETRKACVSMDVHVLFGHGCCGWHITFVTHRAKR